VTPSYKLRCADLPFSKYRDIRSVVIKYHDIGDPHSPMYGALFRLPDASDSWHHENRELLASYVIPGYYCQMRLLTSWEQGTIGQWDCWHHENRELLASYVIPEYYCQMRLLTSWEQGTIGQWDCWHHENRILLASYIIPGYYWPMRLLTSWEQGTIGQLYNTRVLLANETADIMRTGNYWPVI